MPHTSPPVTSRLAKLSPPDTATGEKLFALVDPSPSAPLPFAPQHQAAPPAVRAQLFWSFRSPGPRPVATVANVCPPATGVGLSRLVPVPSPSSPMSFDPQQ